MNLADFGPEVRKRIEGMTDDELLTLLRQTGLDVGCRFLPDDRVKVWTNNQTYHGYIEEIVVDRNGTWYRVIVDPEPSRMCPRLIVAMEWQLAKVVK